MKVRIGIIGLGYWGPNLLRNFIRVKGCEVVSVCDIRQKRLEHARELYPSIRRLTKDYKDVLRDPNIDAVCISTPIKTHFDMVMEALSARKHVFVEKPSATSSSEVRKLIARARSVRRNVMVGYIFMFHPCLPIIKKMLDKSALGRLLYIHSDRLNFGIIRDDINVIWDLMPHELSILNHLMAERPRVAWVYANSYVSKHTEDAAVVQLKYSKKMMTSTHLSWIHPAKVRRMILTGTRKSLVFDDIAQEKLVLYHRDVSTVPYFDTVDEFKSAYQYGRTEALRYKWEEPLLTECRHFVDCILRDERPLTSIHDDLRIVGLIEDICRFIKNMRKRNEHPR